MKPSYTKSSCRAFDSAAIVIQHFTKQKSKKRDKSVKVRYRKNNVNLADETNS